MTVTAHLEKLQNLLRELFQLDQADLDFGIYRIMNHNRDEIVRFLQNDLLPQVQEGFGAYEAADRERLQNELKQAIDQAKDLGLSQEEAKNTRKAKELRQKLQERADIEALEQEVYSHLYNFFRRYYQEGDFLSLQRYKEGVYAIPYAGEEVKLHWANADQYYIKTSEQFRNYVFRLPSQRRVRFEIVAATTERDNNKAPNGKERRFILAEADPVVVETGELVVRFEYRMDEQKRDQKTLNQQTYERIMALPNLQEWQPELVIPTPTKNNGDRTLLEKKLADFTAKNTFDYFIHKDLGGFLRRELDFYIKSEVMRIEDIENDTPTRIKHFLSKVKVLRFIAHKLITFLAQIEDFQKTLWLKKKFVLETNYCITLDRIPEALYPDIIANKAQIEEWKRLFAINEIEGDLVTPKYTEPLTVEFLRANPFLVLDTKFFSEDFKDTLLSNFQELDSSIDGLLIQSENFHALNLLQEKNSQRIRSIYIYPPYNTGEYEFVYKDNYQHSSWISFLRDRIALGRNLQSQDGTIAVSIDDEELRRVLDILEIEYGKNNLLATLIWDRNRKNDAGFFSVGHEYMIIFSTDQQLLRDQKVKFREAREGLAEAKTLFEKLRKQYSDDWQKIKEEWASFLSNMSLSDPRRRLLRFSKINSVRSPYRDDGNINWPGGSGSKYEVLHPVTQRPCKKPRSGWRYSTAERFWEEYEAGNIAFGSDETTVPSTISYLFEKDEQIMPSVFYSYAQVASQEFDAIFGVRVFDNPKNWKDIARIIRYTGNSEGVVLDYFAGSGTTAHSVINLNREDGGNRKYILVDMGTYFDPVLKPRIQKIIYSKDWKDGKPISHQGSRHFFKYIRLESYEDALNNIKDPQRTQQQELALEQHPRFREEYLLSYKLEREAKDSVSLLNPTALIDPFSYQLKVIQNDDTRYVTVDLVETFNYLLGLTVQRIRTVQTVRFIQGINRKDQRLLILWRNVEQVDNDALDAWFIEQGFNCKEPAFDLLYVNGDNNLANLRPANQTWQSLLIDAEFRRLMFDVEDG